jgi:DNA-binding CsgD family transcriptional regulator
VRTGFRWKKGKLILEIPMTLIVPIELEPVVADAMRDKKLTRREKETLDAVLLGLVAKQIAAKMGIESRTVKFFLSALYRKFGVSGHNELVALFNSPIALRNRTAST